MSMFACFFWGGGGYLLHKEIIRNINLLGNFKIRKLQNKDTIKEPNGIDFRGFELFIC